MLHNSLKSVRVRKENILAEPFVGVTFFHTLCSENNINLRLDSSFVRRCSSYVISSSGSLSEFIISHHSIITMSGGRTSCSLRPSPLSSYNPTVSRSSFFSPFHPDCLLSAFTFKHLSHLQDCSFTRRLLILALPNTCSWRLWITLKTHSGCEEVSNFFTYCFSLHLYIWIQFKLVSL